MMVYLTPPPLARLRIQREGVRESVGTGRAVSVWHVVSVSGSPLSARRGDLGVR
jgi:hypothetical protein